jgi:LmbE family N-acetylglucosaminyl deacetylase
MTVTEADIAKLGTILGVWAHPDDEAWTSSGIMHTAVKHGQRVVCVTATRGESGETADEARWPQSQLADIRTKELEASLAILGVTEHAWLDYPDGGLASVDDEEAVATIAKIIADVQPDTILTFGPDGLTGHPDHQQVHAWSVAARERANSPAKIYCYTESTEKYDEAGKDCDEQWNIYFATLQPYARPEAEMDLCFPLSDHLLAIKDAAYQAHASQTAHIFIDEKSRRSIETLIKCECFVKEAVS